MQMLDGKPKQSGFDGQQGQPYQKQQHAPQQQGGYSNQGQQQQQAPRVNPQEPSINFDDDIPFAPIGLQYPALLNCM